MESEQVNPLYALAVAFNVWGSVSFKPHHISATRHFLLTRAFARGNASSDMTAGRPSPRAPHQLRNLETSTFFADGRSKDYLSEGFLLLSQGRVLSYELEDSRAYLDGHAGCCSPRLLDLESDRWP